MAHTAEEFKSTLKEIFSISEGLGLIAIDVNSGNLHRRVGGYPGGGDHRMPICCDVMYAEMGPMDAVIKKPDSGKGASVVIRYALPR
ncbi:MAG: hypothetical protein WDZ52_10330 [Pseudohongiellaceae bacterium]